MLSKILLWVSLTGALLLLSEATYEFQCHQGEFLNTTASGRSICQKCPINTFWVMRLNAENEMIGAGCERCFDWLESPVGSLDISYCACNNEQCAEETPSSSMGMIMGILITILVLAGVIAALFWCKNSGPELLKAISGRHIREIEEEDERGHGDYERMLAGETPSPNLLDCDIGIEITDEMVDDTGYNNETAKGDHNDIQAVLRAAVISEKRRSRMVSMSSMSELDRYRAGSMNSVSGRSQGGYGYPSPANPAGYGPSGNNGKVPAQLPLPSYSDFAHTRKAQTAL